ncbi:hypothetical protein PUN28_016224 [Cardiocondyla obscurior]|uniref:Uncharacterized protein n=1 Tax=Cardiocondyla obscurior TaxID=286306 RepID=A0AAW2EVT0_9HYME
MAWKCIIFCTVTSRYIYRLNIKKKEKKRSPSFICKSATLIASFAASETHILISTHARRGESEVMRFSWCRQTAPVSRRAPGRVEVVFVRDCRCHWEHDAVDPPNQVENPERVREMNVLRLQENYYRISFLFSLSFFFFF